MKEHLASIRNLVAQTRIEKAFLELNNLLQGKPEHDQHLNEIAEQQGKWQKNRKAEQSGIKSQADIDLTDAQVRKAILDIIGELQNPVTKIANGESNNKTENLPKKILFFASSPLDTGRLQVEREATAIKIKQEGSTQRDGFLLIQNFATTSDRFLLLVLREKPYILHFSGHGQNKTDKTQGGLVLSDDRNYSQTVSAEALSRLFANLPFKVKCIIFNACHSEEHGKALLPYVDYVIGMSTAVTDATAIKFAEGFYTALFEGMEIETAFQMALFAVQAHNLGVNVPVLLKN